MEQAPIPPPTGEVSPAAPSSPAINLLEVARAQKIVLVAVLVTVVASIFQTVLNGIVQASAAANSAAPLVGLSVIGFGVVVLVTIYRLWAIYQLAKALRTGAAWIYVVLSIIPCIGLIVLLVLNAQATNKLKEAGIRIGFMGAKNSDLQALAQRSASNAGPWQS